MSAAAIIDLVNRKIHLHEVENHSKEVLWNVITGTPEIPVLMVWATDSKDARFKAGVKLGLGYYSNFRCIEA